MFASTSFYFRPITQKLINITVGIIKPSAATQMIQTLQRFDRTLGERVRNALLGKPCQQILLADIFIRQALQVA